MGFGQAISTCLGKYASFTGRASRAEFWWFILFYIILQVIANALDFALNLRVFRVAPETVTVEGSTFVLQSTGVGILSTVLIIVLFLPLVSVAVRRLHDTDRTGWWWWLGVLCCIGTIVLIIFWASPGTPSENRYGPPPTG